MTRCCCHAARRTAGWLLPFLGRIVIRKSPALPAMHSLKMDIEGAEYMVIDEMVSSGALCFCAAGVAWRAGCCGASCTHRGGGLVLQQSADRPSLEHVGSICRYTQAGNSVFLVLELHQRSLAGAFSEYRSRYKTNMAALRACNVSVTVGERLTSNLGQAVHRNAAGRNAVRRGASGVGGACGHRTKILVLRRRAPSSCTLIMQCLTMGRDVTIFELRGSGRLLMLPSCVGWERRVQPNPMTVVIHGHV